jgi:hypothetical protein
MLKTSAAMFGSGAVAGVAKAEAMGPDALKSTLTPLGAERAGNAAGTIPAWTGEATPLPADFVPGSIRPDPFAGEKPLFRITAANMAQYQDRLNEGSMAMLQKHSDYYIDVYPTHRTGIAPQYVYDYTYKNASTAQLSPDGNNLTGAYGGTPFPIPTNGKQVMWNHELRWLGTTLHNPNGNWLITSLGQIVLKNYADFYLQFPYYFEGREDAFNGTYAQLALVSTAPAYAEGEAQLVLFKVNPLIDPPRGWAYLIGERRVRLAPNFLYDTPIDTTGGVVDWDEGAICAGALDEYDCKLVGKKEMYIAYNCGKIWATPATTDLFRPKFLDPAAVRWELHRVWVVEMTLLPGKRNVDTRRTMYLDEDTWAIITCVVHDADNQLWKYFQSIPAFLCDIPCVSTGYLTNVYDFQSNEWISFGGWASDLTPRMQPVAELPVSYFTPGELSARAGGS